MKTWQQKFDNGKSPQVKILEKAFGGYPVGTPMYISTPSEIDGFIRKLDVGQSVSVAEMRDHLAHQENAEFTCALTTGIYLRIVSERAYEQYTKKQKQTLHLFGVLLSLAQNLQGSYRLINSLS